MTYKDNLTSLLLPAPDNPAPAALFGDRADAGEVHELRNPATGEVFARVGWADTSSAAAAVDAASDAFPGWAATHPRDRAAAMRAIAESIRENADALGDLIVKETGKRRAEAVGEAMFSAKYFDWFADAAMMTSEQHLSNELRRFVVRRHPVGVVAAVSPWNFPLSIPARKVAPAIASGCPVVQKPSELTPLSTLALTAICAGHLPQGVVGAVVGDGEELTSALVDHPAVEALTFTGSTRVGTILAARAMKSMTRVTMELGGKAPFVVCADADPDEALETLLIAKFRNNGASCIAANNVFVHESLFPRMFDRLADRISSLRVGDPMDATTELGPLLQPAYVDRMARLVGEAEQNGCRVVRGSAPSDAGYFCAPALVDVTADIPLWTEEVFGPVLGIRAFSDIDTVVGEVNSWRIGLGGYVVSSDARSALDLAERLRIGIVGINNAAPNSPEVPFGGFGLSGLGREGALSGLLEFTEEQTLSLAR